MEWLKDKKNLPIVAGMAVFVILIAGLLSAYTMGAFSGSPPAVTVSTAPAAATSRYPGGSPNGYPGGSPNGYPGGGAARPSGGRPAQAAAPAAAAIAKTPAGTTAVNPMVGADPFALPDARKRAAAAAGLKVADMRPPLRDNLPPLDLYTIHPPRPEVPPNLNLPTGDEQLLASTRVSGIVNAADGIFAVVEINGASQTVKPGDALPDGSKVASIQSTGVTLHTASGGAITVPLSNGPPVQNQPIVFGGGYPGGGFPGGYPGGGYPGGGFPGGGYPGGGFPGGFGGGGYPGGGGFPGGGGGGYPGGGGMGGGGGYPGGGPPDGRPE